MKAPLSAVQVCATVSLLVTVTFVPTGTESEAGWKAKLLMVMEAGAAGG